MTEDCSFPSTVSGKGRLRDEYRDALRCGKAIDNRSDFCFSSRDFQIGTFALSFLLLVNNSTCSIHISLFMISLSSMVIFLALD